MSKAKQFYGLMTIAEREPEPINPPKYRVGDTILINGELVKIVNVKNK